MPLEAKHGRCHMLLGSEVDQIGPVPHYTNFLGHILTVVKVVTKDGEFLL